jgi:hypothetical protein
MDLYLHSPIYLHGVVKNRASFTFYLYKCEDKNNNPEKSIFGDGSEYIRQITKLQHIKKTKRRRSLKNKIRV